MKLISYFGRSFPLIAICSAVVGFSVATAHADSFSFVGTVAGSSVDATASLSGTAGSNTLSLTLTNNISNIVNVAQAISGFSFKVFNSVGDPINIDPISITGQLGRLVVVDDNGVAIDQGANGSGVDLLHWGVTGNPDFITALGFAGAGNPADETILGLPSSGMTYSSANGSILDNSGHKPFVMQTANFNLQIGQNLPSGFQFRDVTMFFGTVQGNGLTVGQCTGNCGPQQQDVVPEPASLVLLGTGLAGLALLKRKKAGSSH